MSEVPLCRIMEPEDWEDLRDLAKENEFVFENFDIDWSTAAPYWIVAHYQGELMGAINISPGRPIGRMECLFLKPDASRKAKTLATLGLTNMGQARLARAGSQIVCGMIQEGEPTFWTAALKYGWTELASGTMYARGVIQ